MKNKIIKTAMYKKLKQLPMVIILSVLSIIYLILIPGCSPQPGQYDYQQLDVVRSMELSYAEQFTIDYLSNGLSVLNINESGRFLIVPEGMDVPDNVDADMVVLKKPIENVYLQATAAMCLFNALDIMEHISMSGTKKEGWHIENAKKAMEDGSIVFAGKYSSPDYEMLVEKECGLALESTMIYHSPKVKEQLELLGIPVMVERSSYETHPLGRTEWIKVYGHLFDQEELAQTLFDEQTEYLNSVQNVDSGKTVAFFYISSVGSAIVRKSSDYTVKMIEMAGGRYIFSDLGEAGGGTGSVNMEMERFYLEAKEADIIIYNSSIDGQVYTLDELIGKNHLIADFKAAASGDIWCTSKDFFQETTEFGLMIADMSKIFSDNYEDESEISYYYRLK